jgi:hypothetical protein
LPRQEKPYMHGEIIKPCITKLVQETGPVKVELVKTLAFL